MRTTITLDPDALALVRQRMRDESVSFKQAVNDAIRAGLGGRERKEAFHTRTAPMGTPSVNLDRALQLAAELEDEELVRRMRLGK
ncbi:MAG TPA: hypothetical protein VFZ68_04070 [Acidimicrobiales bacterium]